MGKRRACPNTHIVTFPGDVKMGTVRKVIVRNVRANLGPACELRLSSPSVPNQLLVGECDLHHNCPGILELREEFIKVMALHPETSDKARVWAAEQTLRREMILTVITGSTGSRYEIRRGGDGVIYCSCPAWRFRKTCKHLDAYLQAHPEESGA